MKTNKKSNFLDNRLLVGQKNHRYSKKSFFIEKLTGKPLGDKPLFNLCLFLFMAIFAFQGESWGQKTVSNFDKASLWRNESFGKYDYSKELLSKRTENSKHFQNADGSINAIIASGPINYFENGQWKTIYHTIVPTSNGYENTHNSFKSFYPKYSNGILKTQLQNGQEILGMKDMKMYYLVNGQKINSRNISQKSGNVNFNHLTYKAVYGNGIDLRLSQNTLKRDMDYLIQSKNAISDAPTNAQYLVFEEKVVLPQGWNLQLNGQEIEILDQNGRVYAKFDKPVFSQQPTSLKNKGKDLNDELNQGRRKENVNKRRIIGDYTIQRAGNVFTIQTLVPMSWLGNVNTQFPVVIDPTFTVFSYQSTYGTGYIQTDDNGADTQTLTLNSNPVKINGELFLGLGDDGTYYYNLNS